MEVKLREGTQGMKVIPSGERKCIWMEAGVVSYKLCNNNYQCSTCEYDMAMSNKAMQTKERAAESTTISRKKEIVEWMEEFRNLPSDQRKCRYMLMGDVSYKICPNSFRCGDCTFDQMMQDRIQPTFADVKEFPKVAGLDMPDNLFYFRNHLWLHLERNGLFRIGIDDFARRMIGKINKIDLPAIGSKLELEEGSWVIHHDYGDIKFLSPIEGVVESINHDLLENAQLAADKSYTDGWLMTIDPKSIRKSTKNYLTDTEAKIWMTDEANLLSKSIQEDVGLTLQDGAQMTTDISGNISKEKWNELVKKHLYVR